MLKAHQMIYHLKASDIFRSLHKTMSKREDGPHALKYRANLFFYVALNKEDFIRNNFCVILTVLCQIVPHTKWSYVVTLLPDVADCTRSWLTCTAAFLFSFIIPKRSRTEEKIMQDWYRSQELITLLSYCIVIN